MALNAIYLAFVMLAIASFSKLPVRKAILLVFLGGWLVLPVGDFPPVPADVFPWWITGLAVPSDMLVTKAWIAPLVALAGAALFDSARVRRWRPAPADALMGLWCLWPLLDGSVMARPAPSPIVAALYVTGCWGLPWLLGRIWFGDPKGRIMLIKALALSGLACLPFAIVESVTSPIAYSSIYGPHPFRMDGAVRYFGYRPLGFFENGNQYGIWTALSALAAIWVAAGPSVRRHRYLPVAAVTAAMAIASQSVGAILLLLAGVGMLVMWRTTLARPAMIALVALVALAGALHVSGIVPIRSLVETTQVGGAALDTLRASGRGSFAWRISQDIKTLGTVREQPLLGTAVWDWWRPYQTRPWGLAILLLGQYGAIGLALAFGSLGVAIIRVFALSPRVDVWSNGAAALPLAIIVLMTLGDALLNAFIYFPAILAAGAITARPAQANPQ